MKFNKNKEELQRFHENYGQIRAAKRYLLEAKLGKLPTNWYEKLIKSLKSEYSESGPEFCKNIELS